MTRHHTLLIGSALLAAACTKDPGPWLPILEGDADALLSITGTSAEDVWAVGADHGYGPSVLHWDGEAWSRVETGTRGDLWWAAPVPGGPVFFAGEGGTVLRLDGDLVTREDTPGAGHHTIFGIWAGSASDVWVTGGYAGRSGFVWRYDGTSWTELLLPLDIPRRPDGELPPLLKVWGDGDGTVWVVGGMGTVLRSEQGGDLEVVPTDTDATLFTVHGRGDGLAMVGVASNGQGVILERDGDAFVDRSPEGSPGLQGICLDEDGRGIATGFNGWTLSRGRKTWEADRDISPVDVASLHGAWIDPEGGQWTVGGSVLDASLSGGLLLYRGDQDLGEIEARGTLPSPDPICPADRVDLAPGESMARRWNEILLDAIRRDIPRPGVHARNLFHVSAAMYDAWAAYDPEADGVFYTQKHTAADVAAAREEAISYAAFQVLKHRYAKAQGGPISEDCFRAFLESLGFDPDSTLVDGDSPEAVGNRIGLAIVDLHRDDGANEANDYADTTGFSTPNSPIVVDAPGAPMVDPDVWTPLNLAVAETQNGLIVNSGVQGYIGAQWKEVTPWALTRPSPEAPYVQPPVPFPKITDPNSVDDVVEVIRLTSLLDPTVPDTMDGSPGSYGNNPLGSNAGTGHPINPKTGAPYAPNLVKRADFFRILAEYWADGPKSETPPGHWNTIYNRASDTPQFARRLFGEGPDLDALEYDVKAYLALNGAVHDAAIVAWELKRLSLGARPIMWIRYMGAKGQRTDSSRDSYDPMGLPLIPGLIEEVTPESSAPGERHQHLRHFVGEMVLWTWRGEPGDRMNDVGGHAWVRAKEWIPYQRRTFVTPAFPGYVSGHSTFSRSAAVVLHQITGDAFFPGGLGTFTAPKSGYLVFEDGPSQDTQLQWGTWYDAADQAGQSRLWGGIHIWPDDVGGRLAGEDVGHESVEKARRYFEGDAR